MKILAHSRASGSQKTLGSVAAFPAFKTGSQSLALAHSRCLIFVHGINETSLTTSSPQTLPLHCTFPCRGQPIDQHGNTWPPSRAGSPELQCLILVTRGRSLLRFLQGLRSLPFRGHGGGGLRGLERVRTARSCLFAPLGKEPWYCSPETQ